MQKISKKQKKELIAVLEKLILIIQKMRKMKDESDTLRYQEEEVTEWIDYLLAHDTKEDIDKLYSHAAELDVFVFHCVITYSELKGADTVIDENFIAYKKLNSIRIELMDEFLWCCNKCVS